VISTFHGQLPLVVTVTEHPQISAGGRVDLCKVQGAALGQYINAQVTLDVNTGELLLMSPDGFVGSFRLGDLIVSHVQHMSAIALQRHQEAGNAQAH